MRTLILIIIIVITGTKGIAQDRKLSYDSLVSEFFRDAVNDVDLKSNKSFVANNLDSFMISQLIESIEKPVVHHTIRFLNDSLKSQTIKFTAEEKLLIKSQIEMPGKKWLTKVFEELPVTTRLDTIYTKRDYLILNFSRPVFLRDNSLCVFYQSYSCGGLCGHGQFGLYRKFKGKWVQVSTFFQWIS